MATILDLPEALLNLIFDLLNGHALRAASLAVRGWSSLAIRHRCRRSTCNVSTQEVHRTIALLDRLDDRDLLQHVQHLTINDNAERSHDGEAALQASLTRLMPRLTGLKTIEWDTSCKSEHLDHGFRLQDLPPGIRLDIRSKREMHVHAAMSIWFDVRHVRNLHSLTVQYGRKRAPWSGLLEAALVKCDRLKALSITVGAPSSSTADYAAQESGTGLHWTPDQARRLSALEELEFRDSGVTEGTYQTWAQNGDWSCLKKLNVGDDRLLKYLVGRMPRLTALSARTTPCLRECLEGSPHLKELRVAGLGSHELQSDAESSNFGRVSRLETSSSDRFPPTCKAFSFVAKLAEKDWDAAQGKHTISCPELSAAEEALTCGNMSHFGDNIKLVAARKMVDDMTALVEEAVIVARKKPRAMSIWRTPKQEQDRREEPPNWRRRASRTVSKRITSFWVAPDTQFQGLIRPQR